MTKEVDSTSTEFVVPNPRPSFGEFIGRFLGLIRFSHTLFALPFAALASVLALLTPGAPELPSNQVISRLVGVLLSMVFARSAAMAFNRIVDAQIDAANPRTAGRHIPAGLLTSSQVIGFYVLNCLLFLASCLLFLPNWLPLALALPVLAWICGYSLAKRFTSAAHLWLGIALALSPICTWIAIRGEVVIATPMDLLPAVVLAGAIALWVTGFDIIYACQDADFDKQQGLFSVPARLGIAGALRVSALLHACMLVVLAILPFQFPQLSLGWLYLAGLFAVALLVLREHSIVKPSDLQRVGEAFFTINALISVGLCGIAALDAWL